MNVAGLKYSMAAGYLPASPVYASHFNKTSYNIRSGGGGNRTRVPDSASTFPKCGHDMTPGGWLKILRCTARAPPDPTRKRSHPSSGRPHRFTCCRAAWALPAVLPLRAGSPEPGRLAPSADPSSAPAGAEARPGLPWRGRVAGASWRGRRGPRGESLCLGVALILSERRSTSSAFS